MLDLGLLYVVVHEGTGKVRLQGYVASMLFDFQRIQNA